jgi:hypothetical protein
LIASRIEARRIIKPAAAALAAIRATAFPPATWTGKQPAQPRPPGGLGYNDLYARAT